jgi:hypothetical protein
MKFPRKKSAAPLKQVLFDGVDGFAGLFMRKWRSRCGIALSRRGI